MMNVYVSQNQRVKHKFKSNCRGLRIEALQLQYNYRNKSVHALPIAEPLEENTISYEINKTKRSSAL